MFKREKNYTDLKRIATGVLLLSGLAITSVTGQQDFTETQSFINIGLEEVNCVFTPSAIHNENQKSGATANSNIVVTYTNFPDNAIVAFEYAMSIWEQNISSSVIINVHAIWETLPKSVLGHGKPALFLRNYKSNPMANVFYPIALVEKITGKEHNNSNEADINCSFNATQAWYYGTNGKTPSTQYDFVTAVLHEIGHGLGISGCLMNDDGNAQYSNSSDSPSIYDYYLFNANQQRITDLFLFPSSSEGLNVQLTCNALVFNYSGNDNTLLDASIYAPKTWINGVSIYHIKKTNFAVGATNELMNAYAYKGEANHDLGSKTLQIINGIGWNSETTEPITTGIGDTTPANEDVNIYPNPFTNNVTFEWENTGNQSTADITVTDLMGKTVYHETMNDIQYNPKLVIDLSDIKSGIYLASLTDMDNKKVTKRIIKK